MPTSRGYIVPELRNSRVKPTQFNVMLLDLNINQLITVNTYVEMLHDYLDTLGLERHRIILNVVAQEISPMMRSLAISNEYLEMHQADDMETEYLIELSKALNVDIILDEIERFDKSDIHKNRETVAIVQLYDPYFTDLLNAICTGWGVVWNFRDPVWNASMVTKYLERTNIARKVFDLMAVGQSKGYSAEQINLIRNTSNKVSQLLHAKQNIEYTTILLRYARRNQLKSDDLLFELTYHLSSYFFFMTSSLDTLARACNSIFQLRFQSHESYTIDGTEFLIRMDRKRKSFTSIVRLKKYLDWVFWLRRRRNFFAHESHLYLTPLIQRKANQLTEAEINQRVEESLDWAYLASTGTSQEAISAMKESSRFQIDLEENHETVVNDLMTLEKQNRITGETKKVIYFPLRAVGEDYIMFEEFLGRIIANLSKARK